MRTTPLAKCEKHWLLRGFIENLRLDQRKCDEYRPMKITLGSDYGSCLVRCGRTKVLCQVRCDLGEPKGSRPREGVVEVNVTLSPMASPNFERGRWGAEGVELCSLLERLVKGSGCLDTESLCLKVGKRVWRLFVEVTVLDHCGSLVDCASVAAITALAHFRRPDVSIKGHEITVFSIVEREPVPLNLYHYPVAVTFGLTEQGLCTIVEPNEREELVLEGTIVMAANRRRELCAIHSTGAISLNKATILRCASRCVQRANDLANVIKQALNVDRQLRLEGKRSKNDFGFAGENFTDKLTLISADSVRYESSLSSATVEQIVTTDKPAKIAQLAGNGPSIVKVGKGAPSLLGELESGEILLESSSDENADFEIVAEYEKCARSGKKRKIRAEKKRNFAENQNDDLNELLGDIESDVAVLQPEDLGYEKSNSAGEIQPNFVDIDAEVYTNSVTQTGENDGIVDLSAALKKKKSTKKTKKQK